MPDTPEELKAKQELSARYYDERVANHVSNPSYGTDIFNPESYQSTLPGAGAIAANPDLAQPLPQGRQIDSNIPSELNNVRLGQLDEYRKNSQKYIADNTSIQLNEQSLLDRGKSMLGQIFDYRDDADLSVFGVNLSAVESVWDSVVRHGIGVYDVANVGIGWGISAMPGGIQTLDGGQLSGEKTFLQVLNGEMEPGDAPSPGQIAIASVAFEAKRIREGGARLSDVLLMNPATAPFILAGLAADTSPLQAEGFNLLDKKQRDAAFSQGWEQWMSGVTDAGLSFADPFIAAGIATKVARVGLLGARTTVAKAALVGRSIDDSVNEAHAIVAQMKNTGDVRTIDDIMKTSDQIAQQHAAIASNPVGQIQDAGKLAELRLDLPQITTDMVKPAKFDTPLGSLIWDISVKDAKTGIPVMDVEKIMARSEIKALTNKGSAASLLHTADSPLLVGLVLKSLTGTKDALPALERLAPALAEETFRFARENIYALSIVTEGQKVSDSASMLAKMGENLDQEIVKATDDLRAITGGTKPGRQFKNPQSPQSIQAFSDASTKLAILRRSRSDITELHEMIISGRVPSPLDPTSLAYNAEQAKRILADLHSRSDVVTRSLNDDIYRAATEARQWLPGKDNLYVRGTLAHRERAARAAWEYSQEGSGILPTRKLIKTETAAGALNPVHEYAKTGWFSASEFAGTSRIQRAARVWRWLGTETPSGYIALKGTNTVGSEREFTAALNLNLYKGSPVEAIGADGIKRSFGGAERKNELTQRFMAALNDPKQDAAQVLWDIEEEIMADLAGAYGHNLKDFEGLLNIANGKRAANLETLRREHYAVDENGNRHYVAFLTTHLANGTYMQNFTDLERILKQHAAKDNGERLRQAFKIPDEKAGSAYEIFSSFWRPLTLLRMSYTTRNVFEGMVRAMAYSSSLVPLTWPARATYHGVKNKAVLVTTERNVKKAANLLPESDYAKLFTDYSVASSKYQRLRAARRDVVRGVDSEPMMYVFERNADAETITRRMSIAEYDAEIAAASKEMADKFAILETNASKFSDAVKGTKFGTWREAQITDLQKSIDDYDVHIARFNTQVDELNALGKRTDDFTDKIAEINEVKIYDQNLLDSIKTNPTAALSEYKGQAGRQTRIGSGTSIGPDGNKYSNAWEGPLAHINWGNMSADSTTKQRMSLIADVYHGLMNRYIDEVGQPIAYSELAPDAWAAGMANVIETSSSSPVIMHLVQNGFNVEETSIWLRTSDEGNAIARATSHLASRIDEGDLAPSFKSMGITDDALTAGQIAERTAAHFKEKSVSARIDPMMEDITTVTGDRFVKFDERRVYAYVEEVANTTISQMHGREEFQSLLARRVQQKTGKVKGGRSAGGMNAPGSVQNDLTKSDILTILKGMSVEDRARLGYTSGSRLVNQGTKHALQMYRDSVNAMFRVLGTIPEDAVTRGPFYQMRFKATRNELLRQYWDTQGVSLKEIKKARKDFSGEAQNFTIEHPEFKIPANELNKIMTLSHRRALADTKEWMYTIDRRTNLGKYGEWIFPFISATQNSATVGGKLLWKEPWLAPFIADLWRMPQRAGFEDDQGNLHIVVPKNWVTDYLKSNPDVPVLGGMIDSTDEITIPKNGINVFMPESGFGFAPTPAPLVQIAASEMMKRNLLPVETPEVIKSMMGDQAATEFWGTFKDYMFGEQGGLSSSTLSLDKITPAWFQKFLGSKDELSADYGYQFTLQYQTQNARYMGGERSDRPTEDEINKRTTNMFLFNMLGNIGVPTPYTPYPILTRPQVKNPGVEILVNTLKQYREADPVNASANFQRDFGDWALQMANTKVTISAGGANITPETDSDIVSFDSLLRDVSSSVGDNTDVLGVIVNNRGDATQYDTSAYEWQKSKMIPGRNEPWRKVLSPDEAILERQRVAGWTIYRRFMDTLDARLQNAGFKSYESSGAQEFKSTKKQFLENMLNNKEYSGWVVDYQDRSGDRTIAAVRVMAAAVADPEFNTKMTGWGKDRTLSAMHEYLFYRQGLINTLKQTGHGIDAEENSLLKVAWATIRQNLRNSDVRWAEISDLYLSGDDDPTNPGQFMPVVEGVSNER